MTPRSDQSARGLDAPPRRRLGLTYPNRQKHGMLASLFPRDYGQLLLIGIVGKAAFLLALACGFVIAAAVAAGRLGPAFLYVWVLIGIGLAVYELLADWEIHLFNRTIIPIRPGRVAILILALSGACCLLAVSQVSLPVTN
jgi:hypothetical protein